MAKTGQEIIINESYKQFALSLENLQYATTKKDLSEDQIVVINHVIPLIAMELIKLELLVRED